MNRPHIKADKPRPQKWLIFIMIILLLLTSFVLEHSTMDLAVTKLFYQGDGRWMVDKQNQLMFLAFYTTPKYLLISLEVYILAAYLHRQFNKHFTVFRPLAFMSTRTLAYLSLTLLSIPLMVGGLKAVTHVACPVNLQAFGGDLPYVNLIQSIALSLPAKCFPAAHASVGFALYAFAFVPELKHPRRTIILLATLIGMLMGGYKMLIGDHFLSHTIASLLLAWLIAQGLAALFYRHS